MRSALRAVFVTSRRLQHIDPPRLLFKQSCTANFSVINSMATNTLPTEGLSSNCWQQNKQTVQYPPLRSDLQTDVVIVGAGISGLTTAYRLVSEGRRGQTTSYAYACTHAWLCTESLSITLCNGKGPRMNRNHDQEQHCIASTH